MIEKVLPFLNRLLPTGLAFKGLGKVSPKIGKYLSAATAAGYGAEETLDYLREQFNPEEGDKHQRPSQRAANARVSQGAEIPRAIGKAAQIGATAAGIGGAGQVIGSLFGAGQGGPEQAQQPQAQQIPSQPSEQPQPVSPDELDIAQYSPELMAFIEHWLGQGEEPGTIGSIVKNNPKEAAKFKRAVQQIEQASGMDFIQLMEAMYKGVNKGKNRVMPQQAGQQQAQAQAQQAQAAPQQMAAQQAGLPATQQQAPVSKNQQDLMAALQDLTKRLGK